MLVHEYAIEDDWAAQTALYPKAFMIDRHPTVPGFGCTQTANPAGNRCHSKRPSFQSVSESIEGRQKKVF